MGPPGEVELEIIKLEVLLTRYQLEPVLEVLSFSFSFLRPKQKKNPCKAFLFCRFPSAL